MVVYAYHLRCGRKFKIGDWWSRQSREKRRPISKITRAKRIGGMAQAVACLPCKRQGLNSCPGITKIIIIISFTH
jgi:hypothetical protein